MELSMSESEPFFWMGGRLASDLREISTDPVSLSKEGFWAVSTTFEGEWMCARFGQVVEAAFPAAASAWRGIDQGWTSSMNRAEYQSYVDLIRSEIARGWVYQVNACRELRAEFSGQSLAPLMQLLLRHNPAPYASYLRLPHLEIASASPELFLQSKGGILLSGPIKGTKSLTASHLEFGEKDKAENIMIVDLIRNDLSQICQTGTVTVPNLLQSQDHPGLSHLVSFVQGRAKQGTTWKQMGEAMLPPGSVSGAPKSSAVETINRMEGQARGPYCGALGWVEGNEALLSVAIRIFWDAKDGLLRFGTGAGITWGSNAEQEWEETELKAQTLMAIAAGEFS